MSSPFNSAERVTVKNTDGVKLVEVNIIEYIKFETENAFDMSKIKSGDEAVMVNVPCDKILRLENVTSPFVVNCELVPDKTPDEERVNKIGYIPSALSIVVPVWSKTCTSKSKMSVLEDGYIKITIDGVIDAIVILFWRTVIVNDVVLEPELIVRDFEPDFVK